STITSLPFLLVTIRLEVGPTLLPVEMTVAEGPAVGMKPLPVGTSIPHARTVAASMEVKTLATSSESLLILSATTSPSLILLPLIGPDSVGQASPSLTSLTVYAGSSATVRRAED
nr:hypothetical protein [Tanacetum cinerariifolium]